jgi:hypothetical protein
MTVVGAPRFTRGSEGGFDVALDSPSGYTHVGNFPTFDEAADWASLNRRFFWDLIERAEGGVQIVSDPPRGARPS